MKQAELIDHCRELLNEGQERKDLREFLQTQSLDLEMQKHILKEADHLHLMDLRHKRPEPKRQRPNFIWFFLVLGALLFFLYLVVMGYAQAGILIFVLIYLSLRRFRASRTSERNDYFQPFKK